MLSSVTKICDENLQIIKQLKWKNLLLEASYVFNVQTFMGNTFLQSGDTEVFKAAKNKLFVSNEKQIDNHTLMLDKLHSYMSVVCTYHSRGVLKTIFWCGCCSLLIFVAEKAIKGTGIQFLCT